MWERTIRFRSMRNKPEVERRVRILGFWQEHGTKAVRDAFGVSERTLFRWQFSLALARGWGHEAVDLGRVGDDRDALRAALDGAGVDVILTSGGASAGDEDHLSALMREEGRITAWRIALKPGRPLALGTWGGVPLFGLPGNPVAALVCAAIFARPALGEVAGGHWPEAQGFDVPAGFSKSKKPGRREFLRARMRDGRAEVFASEGSGRISGLSWAEGLVELPDGALEVAEGDLVKFIPYAALGI